MKLKIKIKRTLSERYELSPTTDLPIEKLFSATGMELQSLLTNQQQIETIFNKDLVFYDLETTGLRRSSKGTPDDGEDFDPSDTIHQIACLRYASNGNMDDLNPENPTDAYIAKCEIPKEQLEKTDAIKAKRANILFQTPENNYTEFKEHIKDGMFDYPTKTQKDVAGIQALFYHVFINNTIANMKSGRLNARVRNEAMINFILDYTKNTTNSENDVRAIENFLAEKNPSMEKLQQFFESVFDDSGPQSDLARFFLDKGRPEPDKFVKRYSKTTGITIEENKVFTHYDEFPLKKYQKEESYYGMKVVPEKVALQGMMNYFDKLGQGANNDPPTDGDYILVGQNIISFDNPFVLNRCKALGIPNVHTFQNSRVYDTRFLFSTMIKYFKNLVYFYNIGSAGAKPGARQGFVKSMEAEIGKKQASIAAASVEATGEFKEWLKTNYYTKALTRAQKEELRPNLKKEYEEIYRKHKALQNQTSAHKSYSPDIEKLINLVRANAGLKSIIDEVKIILINLTSAGKPRGKLATLMKAFIKPSAGGSVPKQQHTADDDCEKLAMVLIPALKVFYKVFESTKDFVLEIDKIKTVQGYRVARGKSASNYFDPEKDKWVPARGFRAQSQKKPSAIGFENSNLANLRKKVANKIYLDLFTSNKLSDEHKIKNKDEIVSIFKNSFKSTKDSETLRGFLGWDSSDSIKWYESEEYKPDVQRGLDWSYDEGDNLVNENKKRIKIKIIRS
jgi:hypothetical protein